MADEFFLETIKYNSGLVMAILIFTAIYVSTSAVDVIISVYKKHFKKHDS